MQNLTFRNGACCTEVLQLRGDAILKKLANHPSEGVQQFATGALANLQLHHNGGGDEDVMALADKDVKFGKRAPCVGNGCVVAATSRELVAAVAVQAVWRGREGRRRCANLASPGAAQHSGTTLLGFEYQLPLCSGRCPPTACARNLTRHTLPAVAGASRRSDCVTKRSRGTKRLAYTLSGPSWRVSHAPG